jgi:cob(I)alamin adenosyltransferase
VKIYTRGGDEGETSLHGGERVRKSDLRVATYGTVDELNATLGVARAALPQASPLRKEVEGIQRLLHGIAAEIATPVAAEREKLRGRVGSGHIGKLESTIDAMQEELPELANFILPGGGPAGAALHVSRTVCRRAERALVELAAQDQVRSEVLRFVNRLSDWLFVASRWANHREGQPEIRW